MLNDILREVETLGEAITVIGRAQFPLASVNSWAWRKLERSTDYLKKQQAALCSFHFLEHQTIGDFRKVEDARKGA